MRELHGEEGGVFGVNVSIRTEAIERALVPGELLLGVRNDRHWMFVRCLTAFFSFFFFSFYAERPQSHAPLLHVRPVWLKKDDAQRAMEEGEVLALMV